MRRVLPSPGNPIAMPTMTKLMGADHDTKYCHADATTPNGLKISALVSVYKISVLAECSVPCASAELGKELVIGKLS